MAEIVPHARQIALPEKLRHSRRAGVRSGPGSSNDLVVVSNRLPVRKDGNRMVTSPGGLVSALTPLLRQRHGLWVGWMGEAAERLETFEHDGIRNLAVPLSQELIDDSYMGFCNQTLWPLLHVALRTPVFHRTWWDAYRRVNEKFAETLLDRVDGHSLIWVHDYHLFLLPGLLRQQAPTLDLRFFLHTPFPPVEVFAQLPWRAQVIRGLLAADLIGFQTERAAQNFKEAAVAFAGASIAGDRLVTATTATVVRVSPISVDVADFRRIASSPSTQLNAAALRQELGEPRRVLLGVDRLDYTKGIDARLRAFEKVLDEHPDLAETTQFIQIAVPSRQAIGDYEQIRGEIEHLAGRIDGKHGWRHRMPVHYLYDSLSRNDLVTYYAAADVMVVTPLADGMNLVAKEYVASRTRNDGVLVLSEFAGAAQELSSAVMVNPYDIDGLADRLYEAMTMPAQEEHRRMAALRGTLGRNDLLAWANRALSDLVPAVAI